MAGKPKKSLDSRGLELAALFEAARAAQAARPPQEPEELPFDGDSEKLASAVERLDEEVVQSLLSAGVDPNIQTKAQVAPFLIACRKGQPSLVQRFLEAGAQVTTQAVEIAALLGHRRVLEQLVAQPVLSQGRKSSDRDAFSVARERALQHGWTDIDALLRPHREGLGLVRAKNGHLTKEKD